ncbi:MAG: CDP-glycerol glycerophosphotransferase family protein [Actinomycetes bacterium]
MNTYPDVSIIVPSDGELTGLFANQTLSSLEVVADFPSATGTWVLFAPDHLVLERHIVKNLLLAAEEFDADIGLGAVRSAWIPTVVSADELAKDRPELASSHLLFRRSWLKDRVLLLDELVNGVEKIPTSVLHEAKVIVTIAQEVIAPKVKKAPNPKNAKGSPFKNLPTLGYFIARILPLKNEVLFDVEGSRAIDSALPMLAKQWQQDHPKVPQRWITAKQRNSFTHAWHLGRARWLVVNEVFRNGLPKREGQTMVVAACAMPLLRVGRDNPDWVLQPTSERRPAWSQVGRWDIACVASPLGEQILRSSTAYVGEIVRASIFGDALVAAATDSNLRSRLALDSDRPVAVFTFFTAQSAPNLSAIAESFKDKIQFIAVTDDGSRLQLPDGVTQVIHDIPSWLAASDLMITDWSVLTLEFGRLKRPVIALETHHLDVVRRRGTYLNLTEVLPGVIAESVSETLSLLNNWLHARDSLDASANRSESFAALAGSPTGDAAASIWSAMAGEQ